MVTGSWVSLWKINEVQCLQQWNPEYFKEPERYRKYCAAIYQYYDENGQQLYNTTVDGRQINEDGVWRDPSIVPLREDGTVDLWRLDWDGMHYFSDELKEQYTKEDFYNRLRQFPEYVGETVNPYGAIEMEFSGDISSQEVDALLILLDKDLEDAIWKAHGLDD